MQKSKRSTFAFTYRKNVGKTIKPVIADYQVCIDTLNIMGQVVSFIYEDDSRGKLHIHGIVELPKNVQYTKLAIKGYASKFTEIFDLRGWLAYMEKDQSIATAVRDNTWWMGIDHDKRLEQTDFTKNLMKPTSPRS